MSRSLNSAQNYIGRVYTVQTLVWANAALLANTSGIGTTHVGPVFLNRVPRLPGAQLMAWQLQRSVNLSTYIVRSYLSPLSRKSRQRSGPQTTASAIERGILQFLDDIVGELRWRPVTDTRDGRERDRARGQFIF